MNNVMKTSSYVLMLANDTDTGFSCFDGDNPTQRALMIGSTAAITKALPSTEIVCTGVRVTDKDARLADETEITEENSKVSLSVVGPSSATLANEWRTARTLLESAVIVFTGRVDRTGGIGFSPQPQRGLPHAPERLCTLLEYTVDGSSVSDDAVFLTRECVISDQGPDAWIPSAPIVSHESKKGRKTVPVNWTSGEMPETVAKRLVPVFKRWHDGATVVAEWSLPVDSDGVEIPDVEGEPSKRRRNAPLFWGHHDVIILPMNTDVLGGLDIDILLHRPLGRWNARVDGVWTDEHGFEVDLIKGWNADIQAATRPVKGATKQQNIQRASRKLRRAYEEISLDLSDAFAGYRGKTPEYRADRYRRWIAQADAWEALNTRRGLVKRIRAMIEGLDKVERALIRATPIETEVKVTKGPELKKVSKKAASK